MLQRSVPCYDVLQHAIVELAKHYYIPRSNILDLGCSTGITLEKLKRFVPSEDLMGMDSSIAMLAIARKRLGDDIGLLPVDLNNVYEFRWASVIIMNLTLQFIRPMNRDALLRKLYKALDPQGCIILVEKVLGPNPDFTEAYIDIYHDFKRDNKYTDSEIARKREALENVLIPYKLEENRELFQRNGFTQFDIFFKWFNFAGMLITK